MPWYITISLVSIGIAFAAVFIRLLIGPTLADRVIALDMIAFLTIGAIAVWSVASGEAAYLDAALILALIAFLATVAFSRFIYRGSPTDEHGHPGARENAAEGS
jgi:multicomponent Na+:H+ antiporter subunit F